MIYRVDVHARTTPDGTDPAGEGLRRRIEHDGAAVGAIRTRRIFLIDADATPDQVRQAATALLADPVAESFEVFSATAPTFDGGSLIEVHYKPGVMDPVADSTEMALRAMGLDVRQVQTGRLFHFGNRLDGRRSNRSQADTWQIP